MLAQVQLATMQSSWVSRLTDLLFSFVIIFIRCRWNTGTYCLEIKCPLQTHVLGKLNSLMVALSVPCGTFQSKSIVDKDACWAGLSGLSSGKVLSAPAFCCNGSNHLMQMLPYMQIFSTTRLSCINGSELKAKIQLYLAAPVIVLREVVNTCLTSIWTSVGELPSHQLPKSYMFYPRLFHSQWVVPSIPRGKTGAIPQIWASAILFQEVDL